MKSRPVGDELFHVGGKTDLATIIVTFRNFANAHKMLFQVQTPSKTTEMETFWQFGKLQAFLPKVTPLFFSVNYKNLHFE